MLLLKSTRLPFWSCMSEKRTCRSDSAYQIKCQNQSSRLIDRLKKKVELGNRSIGQNDQYFSRSMINYKS